MSKGRPRNGSSLGTTAVFLASLSTILGAILFLRFGFAVGTLGFAGTAALIVLGHLVTIPTALAIAEIATNQRVEGGGAYYIISRSFGSVSGGAIGVALFVSQAVSIAFYIVAFGEAVVPALGQLQQHLPFVPIDARLITLPFLLLIAAVVGGRGAELGMSAIYVVVSVLFVSIGLFLAGEPIGGASAGDAMRVIAPESETFFVVFAICFPAFTGMTAGLGLSGELANPRRSIPAGTILATVAGMLIYGVVAYKLACSAPSSELVSDQFVMTRIAVWGPIIPIGLAAACLSSAIGVFLAAPRTLQAIAADRVLPSPAVSSWLEHSSQRGAPTNAVLLTTLIAMPFVAIGEIDIVAQIITMFFLLTYGAICLISFLEHFAADPSYRPSFRSRWYFSLFGALLCVWVMFELSGTFATLAIGAMFSLYVAFARWNPDKQGLSRMFQGAIFQASRRLQVFLQKSRADGDASWRPSVVCISAASFQRLAAFDLLRWMSHSYGFGTYIHHIEGYLSRTSHEEAVDTLDRLVQLAHVSESHVYVDTIVSPSYTTAITQLVQLPGISGKENNTVLFEFPKGSPEQVLPIVENYPLVAAADFDVCILASTERGFGYRREIHIWITRSDIHNASLMILLAYMLVGHPDWKGAVIKIFSIAASEADLEAERDSLHELIRSGRLPISMKNVEMIAPEQGGDRKQIVNEHSRDADLVILGFRAEALRHHLAAVFEGYDGVGNILFVNTTKEIDLVGEAAPETDVEPEMGKKLELVAAAREAAPNGKSGVRGRG